MMALLRLVVAFWLLLGSSVTRAEHPPTARTADSSRFLEEVSHRSFRYFWETANTKKGLVPDRARFDGSRRARFASIAATGFGLTGYCIAEQRKWITREQATERVLATLRFLMRDAEHKRGYFYHFLDTETGKRAGKCEISSIDTALLIAGVLTCRGHFRDDTLQEREIRDLATRIYERVDWPWMLNGKKTLVMGWKPEEGFLKSRWVRYNELMILYLLGLGSPTHPLPADCWKAWRRGTVITYGGRTFMACPPLFTHQYSHAWFDFRGKHDGTADYWQNSVLATLAHQQFCADMADRFPKYSSKLWGVTASISVDGYKAWGGPPEKKDAVIDGTIVPCAAGGSVPFAPKECIATLRQMRETYGKKVWGTYGFVDAFNPHTDWVAPEVLGIDVGITLLMIENHRSGFVWKTFGRNAEVHRAMTRAGFVARREGDRFLPDCSLYRLDKRPKDMRKPRR